MTSRQNPTDAYNYVEPWSPHGDIQSRNNPQDVDHPQSPRATYADWNPNKALLGGSGAKEQDPDPPRYKPNPIFWITTRVRRPFKTFRVFMMRWYFWTFCIVLAICLVLSYLMWISLRIGTEGKYRFDIDHGVSSVLGIVKSIDLDEKVLKVNWIVGGRDMDYFINEKAWEVVNNQTTTIEPDIKYREIQTSNRVGWVLGEPTLGPYSLPFRGRDFMYDHWPQRQSYPLDHYTLRVFMTARKPSDGSMQKISWMMPYGVLTSWEYVIDWEKSGFVSNNPRDPESFIWVTFFELRRSIATRIFCFLIVIINWLITISVMWLAWNMIVARRMIPRELYSVPMTALFAVPPLRGSMPGVPEVGCMIDYMGLIPNIFIIGFCTVVMIWVAVLRDTSRLYPLERFGWDYRTIQNPKIDGDRTEPTRAMRQQGQW